MKHVTIVITDHETGEHETYLLRPENATITTYSNPPAGYTFEFSDLHEVDNLGHVLQVYTVKGVER